MLHQVNRNFHRLFRFVIMKWRGAIELSFCNGITGRIQNSRNIWTIHNCLFSLWAPTFNLWSQTVFSHTHRERIFFSWKCYYLCRITWPFEFARLNSLQLMKMATCLIMVNDWDCAMCTCDTHTHKKPTLKSTPKLKQNFSTAKMKLFLFFFGLLNCSIWRIFCRSRDSIFSFIFIW